MTLKILMTIANDADEALADCDFDGSVLVTMTVNVMVLLIDAEMMPVMMSRVIMKVFYNWY